MDTTDATALPTAHTVEATAVLHAPVPSSHAADPAAETLPSSSAVSSPPPSFVPATDSLPQLPQHPPTTMTEQNGERTHCKCKWL